MKYAQDWLKQHGRYERRAAPFFYNAIKAQVYAVLDHHTEEHPLTLDQIASYRSIEPMRAAFVQAYEQIGKDAALREYNRLKREEPTKSIGIQFLSQRWVAWMRKFALIDTGDLIQNISDTTLEQIRFALSHAYENGLSLRDQVKKIKEYTLGEIGKARSMVIARTETTRAANEAKRVAAVDWSNEVGTVLYKKWVAIVDGHTRHSHKVAGSEKPILSDDKFIVGETHMDQPGDPTAPAKETVLCRCSQVFLSERKARRDYGIQ